MRIHLKNHLPMKIAKEIKDQLLKRGTQELHTRVDSSLGRSVGCNIHFIRNSSGSVKKKARVEFDIHVDGSAVFSDESVNRKSEKFLYDLLKNKEIDSLVTVRKNAVTVNFVNENETLDQHAFLVISAILEFFKKDGVVFELEPVGKIDTGN
jgi:hypothetical protein